MTMVCRSSLIAAALAALAACGSPSPPDARPTEAERQQALRESAFGGLVEPLDRAAGVEQLQLERKRELDAAIEQ